MKTAHTIKEQHRNALLTNWILLIASTIFFLAGLIDHSKNKNISFRLFLAGTLTAGGSVITAELSKSISARARVQQESDKKGLERQINRELKLDEMIASIKTQQKLAEIVEFTVPDYQQPRIIKQFRLEGMLPPNNSRGVSQESTPESSRGFQVALQPVKELVDAKTRDLIDISWFNENVYFGGGVIVGAKGSGKTDLLKFIVLNILRLCPDVNLKFYNIHYVKGKTKYFEGMDREYEENLFITEPQEILRDAEKCYAELQKREKIGDMSSPPIVRILDEQKATLAELGNEFDRLIFVLKELVDRGRKYGKQVVNESGTKFDTGFVVWLALHNPKKEVSKIDSSWFEENVFLLGKTISNPSSPFPADFDRKTLLTQLNATNSLLEANKLKFVGEPKNDLARACVFRLKDDEPCIKIIPRFNLDNIAYSGSGVVQKGEEKETPESSTVTETPEYKGEYNALDASGDTWIEKIVNWFKTNSDVDNEILREQVNIVRKNLVDSSQYAPLTDAQLFELRELLEQEINGTEDNEENISEDEQ
jgi:hypothetical protein